MRFQVSGIRVTILVCLFFSHFFVTWEWLGGFDVMHSNMFGPQNPELLQPVWLFENLHLKARMLQGSSAFSPHATMRLTCHKFSNKLLC